MLSLALFERSNDDADSHPFDGDLYHYKTLFFNVPIYMLTLFDREINPLSNGVNIQVGSTINSVFKLKITSSIARSLDHHSQSSRGPREG